MTWLGVAVGLLSAAVFGVAAVVQAQAVRGFETTPDGLVGFVVRSIRDVRTMLVVAAYLVGFVLHATAIWLLPLYLAQALVAMSLPVTALASHRVEDALHRTGWLAVGVVTIGLVLLSLGAGEPGEVQTTTGFVVALWIGVAALGVASIVGRHLAGPRPRAARRSRVRRLSHLGQGHRHAGRRRRGRRRAGRPVCSASWRSGSTRSACTARPSRRPRRR